MFVSCSELKRRKGIGGFVAAALGAILAWGGATAASAQDYSASEVAGIPVSPAGVVMPQLKAKIIDTGGTLLFSDSPEYVKTDGILYEDKVSGEGRVLYYHLNDSDEEKKFAVMLENTGQSPVTVTVKRTGDGRPNKDLYTELGKETQVAYFSAYFPINMELKPGEKKLLASFMDKRRIKPGELVYGVYDFHAAGEIKVMVFSYPAHSNPYKFLDNAPKIPADELHMRGTFKNMDRVITLDQPYDFRRKGPACMLLADDVNDPYREGYDAMDGAKVTNPGNYGINYWIDLTHLDGKKSMRLLLAPLGGVYAGALRIHQAGQEPRLLPTPADKLLFGDRPLPQEASDYQEKLLLEGKGAIFPDTDIMNLGSFPIGKRLLLEFSPPGASYLPVSLIIIPD